MPSPAPSQSPRIRLDKWLWAVRIYKTRAEATDACRLKQVRLRGRSVKPAHHVTEGMILEVRKGPLTLTVEVIGLIGKRVGAKLVAEFCKDITPPEERAKAEKIEKENRLNRVFKVPGQGRPDRRQREAMRKFRIAADRGIESLDDDGS